MTTPGPIRTQGWAATWLEPSATTVPHDASGVCPSGVAIVLWA